MSSTPSTLPLPPEVMKVSAVNQRSGNKESSFCWSGSSPETVDKITNELVFGSPSTPAVTGGPTPSLPPDMNVSDLKRICKKQGFTFSISPPPPPAPLSNLIIYLPGSGETTPSNNFKKLASAMDLPQCCSLFLLGKHELPFGLGWGWYQEMDYETGAGLDVSSLKKQSSFETAVSCISTLLESLRELLPLENVFLLSYASGADVAMEVASRVTFGGCICFRGGDIREVAAGAGSKKTQVLQLLGKKDGRFPEGRVKSAKDANVEQVYFDKDGLMGDSKEEVIALFKWLAPRLNKRMPKMEKMFGSSK